MRLTGLSVAALALIQLTTAIAQDVDTPVTEPQVVLNADSIDVDEEENTVIASGSVEAIYEGRILKADRLIYNRDTDRIRASGNVIILDEDGLQRFAEEIETDSKLGDGYAVDFAMRIPGGAVATAGSAARDESAGINTMDRVVFTSCEMCEDDTRPTWALRARRATMDEETQMISYRDAVLEVAGVPVVYFPYFAHPDPNSERRSGFLPPDLGSSSKRGAFYQQPYYWAISPSQDLTISPMFNSKVNPLLGFDYRKRFWSGDIRADFSFTDEQDFDSDGDKFGKQETRGHIFADGKFRLNDTFNWGFAAEYMSDDLYSQRYDIDGENDRRGLFASQPRRLLNQLYAQGQEQNWYGEVAALQITGLRANDDDDKLPRATPLMFAERLFDFGDRGLLSVNASTAYLTRDVGVDSKRASIGADWSASRVLPGGVLFEPFADARYDNYTFNNTASGDSGLERAAGNIGARLSYPLYRPGKDVDILIEPLVMAAYGTPGANNPAIPLEDSSFFEFDESNLLEANAQGGYDLYEGGSKASVGISTTARWKNGVSLTALGGRRWRDDADEAFTKGSNLDGTVSDWVAGVSADFGQSLKFETRARFDSEDLGLNRIDAGVKSRFGRFTGEARYFKLKSSLSTVGAAEEGIELSTKFRMTDHYYASYGQTTDLVAKRDLRQFVGISYEDDCSVFQILVTRSEAIDRTLGPNDSITFAFSLKSLGNFGSADVD